MFENPSLKFALLLSLFALAEIPFPSWAWILARKFVRPFFLCWLFAFFCGLHKKISAS
jgi:hypothetical protein